MTIAHHPSEETLVDYVAGALDEGNSLVMATHIARCSECQEAIRDLRLIAGAILESCASEAVSSRTRSACIHSLDEEKASEPRVSVASPLPAPGLITAAVEPLALYDHSAWRRIGPGVQRCDINVADDTGTRVFLLKASAGTQLPEHHHTGTEWTCVLTGAFTHAAGRFGPGDFDQADASVDHSPIVDAGEDCICLVALNGNIELRGWFGRLMQPFVSF
jgi:putative transcriptional regulator